MADQIAEMIDLVFDLDGKTLPAAYPFALWAALIQRIPQLAQEKFTGVFPLRGTMNSEGLLLPKRAKLVLRLPATLADPVVAQLTGQQFDIAGNTVSFGAAKKRPIHPYPTIHAQLVEGAIDEVLFMENIMAQLGVMGIKGKLICGRRRVITGDRQSILGYSLVVHDLKPEASLQLQYTGLGEHRQFGCGIFVPYKVISGLSDD